MQLLTKGNTKLIKSRDKGFIQEGLHLAPFNLSGRNTCSHASKGCSAACLNSAGFGVYKKVQVARIARTKLFYANREQFMSQLFREIQNAINRHNKVGAISSFRLNLTSDIAWESVKWNGRTLMEHFPNVQFYDYCKNPNRMLRFLTGDFPKNYHLTFSRTENNESACKVIMECGGNVAMVFDKLPKKYMGRRVINGMENDLRFLDPKKVIVGLLPLGKAKKDTTGFVIKIAA